MITIKEVKNKFAKSKDFEDWYDYSNYCKTNDLEIEYDTIMLEYGKQLLIEASERATIDRTENKFDMREDDYYTINKASILNIKNELK